MVIESTHDQGVVMTDAVPVTAPPEEHQADLVAEDLIEEVSIDGMCGVY